MAEQNYNSFEEYLKEQHKLEQKAIFARIFFLLEEMTYDIANGRKKADRMETAEKMRGHLSELETEVQQMLDDLFKL